MKARTMVYLDTQELRALRAEAKAKGISLAEVLRRLVKEHLEQRQAAPPAPPEAYLKRAAGSTSRPCSSISAWEEPNAGTC